MDLSGAFPAPGLACDLSSPRTGRTTVLSLLSRDQLLRRRGLERGEILYEQRLPSGAFGIKRHPGIGYFLEHPFYGLFFVTQDGSQIACTPADLPAWLWQRFLVGQLLPLASLLHGYEPLHASAVGVDGGRALLLMGASGAGKSLVALHLTAAGATFMTDDVSALELRDDAVLIHPGAALASIEGDELPRLPPEAALRWARLGDQDGEVRLAIADSAREARPVAAVYVMAARTEARSIALAPPPSGAAKLLLGGTFNAYVRDRPRLERQIEVVGRLAEAVPVREVSVPPGTQASTVARVILQDQATTASAPADTP